MRPHLPLFIKNIKRFVVFSTLYCIFTLFFHRTKRHRVKRGTKKHCKSSREYRVGYHIRGVVDKRVDPNIHPLGCIRAPKDHAGQKAAKKPQDAYTNRAGAVPHKTMLSKRLCKSIRQANDRKSDNVVKKDTEHYRPPHVCGGNVKAQHHLKHRVYKSNSQAPDCSTSVRVVCNRKHAHGDSSSKRQKRRNARYGIEP